MFDDQDSEIRHWSHSRGRPSSASSSGRPPPSDTSTNRGGKPQQQNPHHAHDTHDTTARQVATIADAQNNNNEGDGKLLTMQIRGDAFAFTTAIYTNIVLFMVAVTRIVLAFNFNVIDSVSESGALWIVVSNAFACVVFVYSFYKFYQFSKKEAAHQQQHSGGGGDGQPLSSKKNRTGHHHHHHQHSSNEAASGNTTSGGGGVSRSKYDVLDTVWGVAWASAAVTTYCEGGSGGGLTVVTLPLFVVIAPAFRVSLLAILPVVVLSIGLVVALFLSHFPGSTFRRFELPLLPAMVLVNFCSTAIIAAWVSHRRTLETQHLSDHYTAMLRVVASTAEHLLLMRSSDAAANLLRLSSELFATPQERRVVGGLTVLSWFLTELASYFPPHVAHAARMRLSQQQQQAAVGSSSCLNPQLVRESRIVLEKAMAMHGASMNLVQQQQQGGALVPAGGGFGGGGQGQRQAGDGGQGGDDNDFYVEDPYEEDPFSQMRKKLCTVMQITLLDFPTHDVKQAALAGQWLADCTVERIEEKEGVVESMTPSSVVASFNFHTPCPVRHARLACDCALSISAAMAGDPDIQYVFAITIDTTQIVGGAMGAGLRRTVSIAGEGLDSVARLAPLANILACPILLTERVQRIVGNKALDIVPVDVADIKWFQRERQRQFVLYELRGNRPRNASTGLSDMFTAAFKAFRGGDLKLAEDGFIKWEKEAKKSEAASVSSLVAKIDFAQSKRLKTICATYLRSNAHGMQLPKPFARRNTVWQLFLSEMPANKDPFFSPLRERLRAARNLLMDGNTMMLSSSFNPTAGGGSSSPGAGGGGNSPGNNGRMSPTTTGNSSNNNPEATPMQAAFKRLDAERQAKVHQEDTGLMTMFTFDDDDDDNNNNNNDAGNNNNTNSDLAMSPSYEGGLQRPAGRNSSDVDSNDSRGSIGQQDSNVVFDPYSNSSGAYVPPPAAVEAPTFGANNVPTEVRDFSEDVWTRSNEPIGSGGFSEVYLGLGHHGLLVAMKFFLLESTKSSTDDLKNEVELLSKLKHDNIVSYVECSFTPSHFVIIMEYVSGGSLEKLLRQFGPLPLLALRKYLCDILRGLEYLHTAGNTVHCDIKPHNCLLHNDGVVKLTDFGSCINASNAVSSPTSSDANNNDLVVRGTPHYMSPDAAKNNISPASDIWSVGVTVLELATADLSRVWPDKVRRLSPQNMVLALSSDEPPVPNIPDSLDPDLQDFVRRCLVVDPARRSTIEELWASPLLAA